MKAKVVHGDCLDVLRRLPDASIHAVVTDPPYGLSNTDPKHVTDTIVRWAAGDREFTPGGSGFMGNAWDAFVPPPAVWDECLRVLKPGGHLLCFAGTRTMGLMELAVRIAGFDIRDSLAWLHSQGFPKGKNLKPSFEPIIVGRKPFSGTGKKNVLDHGVGELNIEQSRIATTSEANEKMLAAGPSGRWPANVVLDEAVAEDLDVTIGETTFVPAGVFATAKNDVGDTHAPFKVRKAGDGVFGYGDRGGPSRYFYVAKANRHERPEVDGVGHPTVKPLTLLRHLVRLVALPGQLVLDPFGGSGTTAEACLLEDIASLTVERESSYLPLIRHRIARAEQELEKAGG